MTDPKKETNAGIVWVAEEDWGTVSRGDLVQFTRGKESVTVLVIGSNPLTPWISFRNGCCYRADGCSLFVQAPPAIVLPTEPGCYLDKDGSVWTITTRFPFREDLHARHAPFTRLEPVPETAKKVLDAVDAAWMRGHHMGDGSASHRFEVVRSLRAEFGVTS